MYPKISVNLGNLVLSLSDTLDLAFSSLAMHQQRTAFIAWELGKKARLPEKRIENVFIAGLLHDIGALSIEEKVSSRSGNLGTGTALRPRPASFGLGNECHRGAPGSHGGR